MIKKHVCPYFLGYFLINPMRRLIHNPCRILKDYVCKDMAVLDVGCAMGYFSLPMAKMVGDTGKIVCVDLQDAMLKKLKKRAMKKNLHRQIQTQKCTQASLQIEKYKDQIDFALAFAVVHEVPNALSFFKEIYESLKTKGKLLMAEPSAFAHVTKLQFTNSIELAKKAGFTVYDDTLKIKRCHSVVLVK